MIGENSSASLLPGLLQQGTLVGFGKVEQNRDAQMRTLLINEEDFEPAKIVPVLYYAGLSMSADVIQKQISDYYEENKLPRLSEAQALADLAAQDPLIHPRRPEGQSEQLRLWFPTRIQTASCWSARLSACPFCVSVCPSSSRPPPAA